MTNHVTHMNESCLPYKRVMSHISNDYQSSDYQIKRQSQFEFVPRDTEESEFLDLVDFGGVAFSVETVKSMCK